MKANFISGIYGITPETEDTNILLSKVELLLKAGVTLFQYRNKFSDTSKQEDQARAMSDLVRSKGGIFIVNDSIKLAKLSHADGVHLGCQDIDLRAAREELSNKSFIGASCYGNITLAVEAKEKGADYVAFGSFFFSTTKPHAPKIDPSIIGEARSLIDLPVVGIGGITVTNAKLLVQAGVDAIAISSGLFDAGDIKNSVKIFKTYFN